MSKRIGLWNCGIGNVRISPIIGIWHFKIRVLRITIYHVKIMIQKSKEVIVVLVQNVQDITAVL